MKIAEYEPKYAASLEKARLYQALRQAQRLL